MKIEIRNITSADIDEIELFTPEEGTEWFAQADVELGTSGEAGGDRFQFEVCSLAWLESMVKAKGGYPTGRMIVFREFTYERLVNTLEALVSRVAQDGRDWQSFARQLNWYLQWEFENFASR